MIDVIGTLYALSEDPEAAPVPLAGWHVNVTPEFMAARPELEPFRVEPSPLLRVWSGDDQAAPAITVPLRFADEAEALSYFPAQPADHPQ